MSKEDVLEPPCFRCGEPTIAFDDAGRPLCSRHSMLFITAPRILAGPVSGEEESEHGPNMAHEVVASSQARPWAATDKIEGSAVVVDLAQLADDEGPHPAAESPPQPEEPSTITLAPDQPETVIDSDEPSPSSMKASAPPEERSPATLTTLVRRGRPLPSQRQRQLRP